MFLIKLNSVNLNIDIYLEFNFLDSGEEGTKPLKFRKRWGLREQKFKYVKKLFN